MQWNSNIRIRQVALEHGIKSIAFPSISTGVYSFPVELVAKIAVKTVSRFLEDNENSFGIVEWVLFDSETYCDYEAEVDKLYKKLNYTRERKGLPTNYATNSPLCWSFCTNVFLQTGHSSSNNCTFCPMSLVILSLFSPDVLSIMESIFC